MWPAKLPGEGAVMYDACQAMCDVMKQLGIAVDGGMYVSSKSPKISILSRLVTSSNYTQRPQQLLHRSHNYINNHLLTSIIDGLLEETKSQYCTMRQ